MNLFESKKPFVDFVRPPLNPDEPPAVNYIPEFVPPHLQGKVGDFRKEENGDVSFYDEANPSGLSGHDANRTTLKPDQYASTFDPVTRAQEGADGFAKEYMHPMASPQTAGAKMMSGLAEYGRKGWEYGTSTPGKSLLTTALITALASGGIGGYRAYQNGEGVIRKSLLYSLIGGATGLGLTALLQQLGKNRDRHQLATYGPSRGMLKGAAAFGSATTDVLTALANDQALSQMQRQAILEILIQMSDAQRRSVFSQARAAAGAGIGVAIARVLFGKGLLSSAAGGMIGAFVGGGMRPKVQKNHFGQIHV